MVSLSGPGLSAVRAVFSRLAAKGQDPPVTARGDGRTARARCAAGGVTVEFHDPGGSGTGEVTVRLSALAAAGSGAVTLRPEPGGKVAVVVGGSAKVTVDAVRGPVPPIPSPATTVPSGPGLVSALAAAAGFVGERTARFDLSRVQVRGGRGEVAATDGRVLYVHGGLPLPHGPDAPVPACPAFAAAELKAQKAVTAGRCSGQFVVTAGPWSVALPVDTAGRFPDVSAAAPDPAKAPTAVELSDAAVSVIRRDVPGLPAGDPRTKAVTLDIGPAGAAVVAGGRRVELPGCRVAGPAAGVVLDRRHLLKAASMGLRRLGVWAADRPVVASDRDRRLVWIPLGDDPEADARPAAKAPAARPTVATGPAADNRPPVPASSGRLVRVADNPAGSAPAVNMGRGWGVSWFRSLVERVKAALALRAVEEIEADAADLPPEVRRRALAAGRRKLAAEANGVEKVEAGPAALTPVPKKKSRPA